MPRAKKTDPKTPNRRLVVDGKSYDLSLNFARIRAFEDATGTGIFGLFDRAAAGERIVDDVISLFEVMAGLGTPNAAFRAWLDEAPASALRPITEGTLLVAYADMGLKVSDRSTS